MTFTNKEKAECANREHGTRIRVYGRYGKPTTNQQREIELMAEIAADYRRLAELDDNDLFGEDRQ